MNSYNGKVESVEVYGKVQYKEYDDPIQININTHVIGFIVSKNVLSTIFCFKIIFKIRQF